MQTAPQQSTIDMPAVVEGEYQPASQQRLDRLAWWMDESIRLPGGYRIGLDGIVGLIPGIGDGVGLATSSYIVWQAYLLGASKVVLGRMTFNMLLESIVGAVPIIGDIFDMMWKANSRNVALLKRHVGEPGKTRQRSQMAVVGFLLMVVVFTLSIVAGFAWLIGVLLRLV